jgi:membrane-associated phospholipid phosphatase
VLTTAPISGFPREDRPVGPGDEANSKTAPGDPAAGDSTSIAATQAPDTITERGTVRQHHRTAIDSITRLVMPEECFFGVFGIALIALVIATGQVHLVIARLVADLRFVAIVVGVALVIFVRAYRRAGPGPTPTVGLDRARLRIGVAVAVRTLREFGPLFACLAIYEALHDLTPIICPNVRDHLLVASDHFVFHTDVGRWLDDHLGSVPVTDVLTACYVSYAFASPIYAGLQYFRGRYREFHDFALAITVAAFIGYAGYLLMPAVGPYVYQHSLYADPLPGWHHGAGAVLRAIDQMKGSARDAFPSLHTAMTTVVLGMMWRDARRLFWTYLPVAVGLYLSTMYLREHYATDVAAGFLAGAIALFVAPRINRWWYGRRALHEIATPIPWTTLPAVTSRERARVSL